MREEQGKSKKDKGTRSKTTTSNNNFTGTLLKSSVDFIS